MNRILNNNFFHLKFTRNVKMIFDIKVAVAICLAPFLIFLHLPFSENSNMFQFLGLEFIHKYPDNQVFVWSFLISFIPFLIVNIIFVTTRSVWRYFLLPLMVYLFISSLMVFTDSWQEYYYLLEPEGLIWALFFLENLFFYDEKIFKKYRVWDFEMSTKDLLEEIIYERYGKLNKRVIDVFESKNFTSLKLYLCKIYYLQEVLNQKSPEEKKEINVVTLKESTSGSIVFAGILIGVITGLLFAYTIIPTGLDKIDFQQFEIGSFGFETVRTFVWYTLSKISLLLLFTWYLFQCKQWWKWSMLSPIIFYTYQLWEVFIRMSIDELQNILVLSPIFILLIIIHFHSKSIRSHLQTLYYKDLVKYELEKQIQEAVTYKK